MARSARIILSLSLFFFGVQAGSAASQVPRQLYGKSVTVSATVTDVWWNDTSGKNNTKNFSSTSIFYFSSQGRIFARHSVNNQFGSRTYEQVGSDPPKSARPVLATGSGLSFRGTSMSTFQDFHFEGRALIATARVGENAASRLTIEFDQNFGSCTSTSVRGSDDGKPIRRIAGNGDIERAISRQVKDRRCTIQDGNAFQQ
jgi:hypothetical protein